jgi:short-subunit dehydrogenase
MMTGSRDTCQQINRVGGSASLIKADLQDTDEIIRMFDFIRENGELTTLINNAAIFYRSNLATLSVTDGTVYSI